MALAESQIRKSVNDDVSWRNQLIAEHLHYVKRIVKRLAPNLPATVETDDLIHAGIIGLIQAVDRYDPGRGNKFITYAMFRIKGAIKNELRSRDFLSRATRKKVRQLEHTYLELERKLGRAAEDQEVAEALGMSIEDLHAIKKMSGISFISLDEIGLSSSEEKENLLDSLIHGTSGNALSMARYREVESALAEAIEGLPEKQRMVVSLYYWDELTMKEIGGILGITESRVSQIHSQAVFHLRVKLRKRDLLDDPEP